MIKYYLQRNSGSVRSFEVQSCSVEVYTDFKARTQPIPKIVSLTRAQLALLKFKTEPNPNPKSITLCTCILATISQDRVRLN